MNKKILILTIVISLLIVLTTLVNSADDETTKELDTIKEGKFKVFHILSDPEESWNGPRGRINAEILLEMVPDWKERNWYVSGLPTMVDTIENILTGEIKIPLEIIKEEYYLGY